MTLRERLHVWNTRRQLRSCPELLALYDAARENPERLDPLRAAVRDFGVTAEEAERNLRSVLSRLTVETAGPDDHGMYTHSFDMASGDDFTGISEITIGPNGGVESMTLTNRCKVEPVDGGLLIIEGDGDTEVTLTNMAEED